MQVLQFVIQAGEVRGGSLRQIFSAVVLYSFCKQTNKKDKSRQQKIRGGLTTSASTLELTAWGLVKKKAIASCGWLVPGRIQKHVIGESFGMDLIKSIVQHMLDANSIHQSHVIILYTACLHLPHTECQVRRI